MNYDDFIGMKSQSGGDSGFSPVFMPSFLIDFQASLTEWAIKKGRAAIFADCGLGKTPMEFVWSQDSSEYAVRDGNVVKLFKNFKEKKQ